MLQVAYKCLVFNLLIPDQKKPSPIEGVGVFRFYHQLSSVEGFSL